MSDIYIKQNKDGSYSVKVGSEKKIFPDFTSALKWAEEKNGGEGKCLMSNG